MAAAAQEPTLSVVQRWMVRETWAYLQTVTSAKGFGSLVEAKEALTISSAPRDDHHDWDESNYTVKDVGKEAFQSLHGIDTAHRLTSTFYAHLFENNPQMREIFWRFNLYQSLEKIVRVLQPDSNLKENLEALALRHRGRGIANGDYDRIRISILYALGTVVTATFTAAHVEAWVAAWDVFADAMKVRDGSSAASTTAGASHGAAYASAGDARPSPATGATTDAASDAPAGTASSVSASAAVPAAALPRYALAEVARHNTAGDAWLVIGDGVYDVTQFIDEHPGGEMILVGLGQDATRLFEKQFHSEHARRMLARFRIGDYERASN